MIHRNLLLFRGARYLWWSLALLVASVVLYETQGTVQPPNGGTWQGYVLGTVGALLILWLTFHPRLFLTKLCQYFSFCTDC